MANVFSLESFLPYRINRLAERASASLAGVYASRYALSVAQWRILATLHDKPGLQARDIAARCNLDKVRVSRAVRDLEDRALLARSPVAGDRRASELRLSGRGRRLFARLAPQALAWQRDFLLPLTLDEEREFRRLLAKLEHASQRLSDSDGLGAPLPVITPVGP